MVQRDNKTCSWLAAGAACVLGSTELGCSHEALENAFAGLQYEHFTAVIPHMVSMKRSFAVSRVKEEDLNSIDCLRGLGLGFIAAKIKDQLAASRQVVNKKSRRGKRNKEVKTRRVQESDGALPAAGQGAGRREAAEAIPPREEETVQLEKQNDDKPEQVQVSREHKSPEPRSSSTASKSRGNLSSQPAPATRATVDAQDSGSSKNKTPANNMETDEDDPSSKVLSSGTDRAAPKPLTPSPSVQQKPSSGQTADSDMELDEKEDAYGYVPIPSEGLESSSEVSDDKWFTFYTRMKNSANPQDMYCRLLCNIFEGLWKQDKDMVVVPIDQDSEAPRLHSPDDLKEDIEFLGEYFSPSNPRSLNLKREKDEDGNRKNRPNLHASIYVISKKPIHLDHKTDKIQTSLRAKFGDRMTFNYKGIQVERTTMSTQFTGLYVGLDEGGVEELVSGLAQIALKSLKRDGVQAAIDIG